MFGSTTKSLLAAGLVLAVAAGSGCASHVVDLVETGSVSMKIHETARLQVSDARIEQFPEEVAVSGHVRFRGARRGGSAGHVDIEVVSSDGRTIARQEANYYPKIISRRGRRRSYFSCRFPGALPEGATVHLRHHRPVHWACSADLVSGRTN